jgi:hypothetical protein
MVYSINQHGAPAGAPACPGGRTRAGSGAARTVSLLIAPHGLPHVKEHVGEYLFDSGEQIFTILLHAGLCQAGGWPGKLPWLAGLALYRYLVHGGVTAS